MRVFKSLGDTATDDMCPPCVLRVHRRKKPLFRNIMALVRQPYNVRMYDESSTINRSGYNTSTTAQNGAIYLISRWGEAVAAGMEALPRTLQESNTQTCTDECTLYLFLTRGSDYARTAEFCFDLVCFA